MNKLKKHEIHFDNEKKILFFNFRVRGIAAAISAAIDYFLSFLSTKTYLYLETSLSLPGISLLNCLICAIGLILMVCATYNFKMHAKCSNNSFLFFFTVQNYARNGKSIT